MNKCIFCEIVKGRADAAKIWEDSDYIAVLDINPNVLGQTVVMTKDCLCSDVFNEDEEKFQNFLKAVKIVADLLKEKLNVKRVAMVAEGLGINHRHIKLYPLHGLKSSFQEMWGKDRIFFEKYEGYITTQLGPQAGMSDLKKLATKFKLSCDKSAEKIR